MHDVDPWNSNVPQPSPRPPKLFVWIVGILSLIGVGCVWVILSYTEQTTIISLPVAKYAEQEMVLSVIGDHTGQVLDTLCYRGDEACSYKVRFSAPLNEFVVVVMHEYELFTTNAEGKINEE